MTRHGDRPLLTRILCRLLTLLLASYFFCLLGNRITHPRANANETFARVADQIRSDVNEGTLFLSQRSAESFKGQSNSPNASDQPIGSASKVPEFERRILDLLAAGKQAEAEALLQEDVARTPTIQNVIALLDRGKPNEAAQIFNAHTNDFQQAKRTLFLYGACLRSRFEVSRARHVFLLVHDNATATGLCARFVLHLDSIEHDPKKHPEVVAVLTETVADPRSFS